MSKSIETKRYARPVSYEEVYRDQIERRDAVERGEAGNALFLLEHSPVVTLGRDYREEDLLLSRETMDSLGISVAEANRGGGVTYHGPGQFVGYSILDLANWRQSIQWYLRALEEVIIAQVGEYGLEGERVEGFTGVWCDGAKVAAIGIGIHNWVTFHGVSLNVDPSMAHFSCIVPCGIRDKPVTTLRALMKDPPSMQQVMDDYDRHFRAHFSDGS